MSVYPVSASRNRNFGVSAFAGAYDAIPSIVAAYGMRRLRTLYTDYILRIRRDSDNDELDIGAIANGDLDTAAIATFIGGGSGYIVNWYDQSGNAYTAAQTTAASQPLYVASGQNGRPVARWDGVNDTMAFSGVTATQIYSIFLVFKTASIAVSQNPLLIGSDSNQNGFGFQVNFDTVAKRGLYNHFVANQLNGNATTSYELWSALRTGGIASMWNNGVSQSITNSSASMNTPSAVGSIGGMPTRIFLNGDITEIIICNAALSDANRQAAEAAANTYWAVY